LGTKSAYVDHMTLKTGVIKIQLCHHRNELH